MNKSITTIATLGIITLITGCSSSMSAQFAPLFNGESLEGWTIVNGDKTTWVAKSNMIVTTGNPTGIMRTNEMYENFILELDWRHMVTNGNAGLFVWSDPIPAIGVPFTRSIEVQIMDGKELDWYTTHGDIFSIWGAQMTPDRPHPLGAHVQRCLPSERRSNPAPEWNHYIVTCIDGTIKLSVNGKVVSGGFDITPRKGYICFEAEGTPAQFKNIIIKVLPNSTPEIPESEIANESIGFVTLFNGINLQGWVTSDETNWNAGGNILHCSKGSGMLTTSTSLKAYELMFDFKCNTEMSSAFVEIDGIKTTLPEGEVGKWSRFTIQGEDKTIGIGGDDASFTNVFIRPLQ
ncbi:MAG: DUF1080 domain-containing protein [Phycisphaerae bacterium]|jgi:hypothetical protein|nr:DUF1080 domain-containing protein [Phycisphaerae bacterium]MBT6269585.1 DUF1080 domain-containing protein [Phycisphaerae bacterium]MBT6282834.1 DUF1080 domain-containing protein [Phycisphaerae bacterium]MBT7657136.1 DUF1080 domain-containing protein [Phycisphaerae bacterium]